MLVIIKKLNRDENIYDVHPNSPISDLKERISEKERTELECVRILYRGKQLDNDKTLSFYNVQDNAIVTLSIKKKKKTISRQTKALDQSQADIDYKKLVEKKILESKIEFKPIKKLSVVPPVDNRASVKRDKASTVDKIDENDQSDDKKQKTDNDIFKGVLTAQVVFDPIPESKSDDAPVLDVVMAAPNHDVDVALVDRNESKTSETSTENLVAPVRSISREYSEPSKVPQSRTEPSEKEPSERSDEKAETNSFNISQDTALTTSNQSVNAPSIVEEEPLKIEDSNDDYHFRVENKLKQHSDSSKSITRASSSTREHSVNETDPSKIEDNIGHQNLENSAKVAYIAEKKPSDTNANDAYRMKVENKLRQSGVSGRSMSVSSASLKGSAIVEEDAPQNADDAYRMKVENKLKQSGVSGRSMGVSSASLKGSAIVEEDVSQSEEGTIEVKGEHDNFRVRLENKLKQSGVSGRAIIENNDPAKELFLLEEQPQGNDEDDKHQMRVENKLKQSGVSFTSTGPNFHSKQDLFRIKEEPNDNDEAAEEDTGHNMIVESKANDPKIFMEKLDKPGIVKVSLSDIDPDKGKETDGENEQLGNTARDRWKQTGVNVTALNRMALAGNHRNVTNQPSGISVAALNRMSLISQTSTRSNISTIGQARYSVAPSDTLQTGDMLVAETAFVDKYDVDEEVAFKAQVYEDEVVLTGEVVDEALEDFEISEQQKRSLNRLACLAVIIVAILVGIFVPVGRRLFNISQRTNVPSLAPSLIPTLTPTAGPTSNRFTESIQFLSDSDISNIETMLDQLSPQYKALKWIADEDDTDISEPNFIQRYVLAVFYYATEGDKWFLCSKQSDCTCSGDTPACMTLSDHYVSFLSLGSECNWYRLKCDDDGWVTHMLYGAQPGNRLEGHIPTEINHLEKLEILDLQNNRISGTIPDSFDKLKNLKDFALNRNKLTGTIPDSFFEMSSLLNLELRSNNLSGSIPSMFGQLSSLRRLIADGNLFTGSIPSEIGNMEEIRELVVWANHLTGSVPGEIMELPNIRIIELSNNTLTGTIPPKVHADSNLKNISFANNFMDGPIPEAITDAQELLILNLGNNAFTGTIPEKLGTLNLMYLGLEHNDFTGTVADGLASLSFDVVMLHDNGLSGAMPEAMCSLTAFDPKTKRQRLKVLSADCTEVICDPRSCCTHCF